MEKKLDTKIKYSWCRVYFANSEIKESWQQNGRTENEWFNRHRRMALGNKPIKIIVGNTRESLTL